MLKEEMRHAGKRNMKWHTVQLTKEEAQSIRERLYNTMYIYDFTEYGKGILLRVFCAEDTARALNKALFNYEG